MSTPTRRTSRLLVVLFTALALLGAVACKGADDADAGTGGQNPAAGSEWDSMNWDDGQWA